jgi:cytochrome c biogenesis protein
MATTETELASATEAPPSAAPAVKISSTKSDSVLDKVLRLLSSVKFGLVMLSTLLMCNMIGMLVMQVNVDGFQKYYANLKPAQKLIYGSLGFFDIYRSRYFTLLLAITGLNIILASIDRFPAAWQYIRKPKLIASPKFIAAQMFNAEAVEHGDQKGVAEKIRKAWRKHGFRARINEENNRVTVFAQRYKWNRLGAYVVHVALLTIFTGGFLTSRYGVGGSMEIKPGRTSDKFATSEISLDGARESQAVLPFQIECTDLQQTLIREEGGLDNSNTIDWLSSIKIIDKERNHQEDMVVHLNNVGDYRGYRFFQNSFLPVGNARYIKISFEPTTGGPATEARIARSGSTVVRDKDGKEIGPEAEFPGIGTVRYVNFYPDFDVDDSGPTTLSRDYNNPAAQLEITAPDGKRTMSFAFNPQLSEQYLTKANDKVGKEGGENPLLVNGNKIILRDFEKVSLTHTLTIQYDPGRTPVYIGFTLLVMALCGVFFFSHQRVWAVIEPNGKGSKIHFGGNTNRNRPAFEGRFNSLVQSVTGGSNDE